MFFVKLLFIIVPLIPSALIAMTLEQKIGQLFVVPACQSHFEEVRNLLRNKHIGGILLLAGDSRSQVEMIQTLESEVDVWTFQDAEWGVGMRVNNVPPLPRNLTLGAIGDAELLKAFGRELAYQCRSVGIQGNFAPVVDVNRNSKNPVIGRRSFGDDPENVTRCGLSVLEGMQAGGILACAKHFPGHGDTARDSHIDLPLLESVDLAPFQALIDAGVEMVMVGHLLYPPLSEEPSSLSHEIVTELLREKMGFKGLIATDALNMKALTSHYEITEIAEKTLLAGTDLLVIEDPEFLEITIPRMIEHIRATVPEDVIDEKVERILAYKQRAVLPMPEENPMLKRTLYRAALTQLGDVKGASSIALVQSRPDPDLESALLQYAHVTVFSYEEMEMATNFPCILINVRKGDIPTNLPERAIVTLFDTPYVLNEISFNSALVGYEDVLEAKEAVADALFGKLTPLGKLPIRLCKEWGGVYGSQSSE